MNASIKRGVCLEDDSTAYFSFNTQIGLIAFRYSQRGIEPARKSCIENSKLLNKRRASLQCLGESEGLRQ